MFNKEPSWDQEGFYGDTDDLYPVETDEQEEEDDEDEA